jgi:hypothetical protein
MGGYVDVAECQCLISMHVEQGLGLSVLVESLQLIAGKFEDMRIRFCWVNGEFQEVVFYVCHPAGCQ